MIEGLVIALAGAAMATGWAALHHYGLTDQLPFAILVATTRKRRKAAVPYGNGRIEFAGMKGNTFNGFHRMVYQGKEIFVAEKFQLSIFIVKWEEI